MPNRVYVSPDTSRGAGNNTNWIVKTSRKIISKHRRKRRALNKARRVARGMSPSVLVIQRQDGVIQEKRSY